MSGQGDPEGIEQEFGCTKKQYMHNSKSVFDNEIHKLLWDFEIQTDLLISAKRPDLVIVNKRREPAKLWTLLFQQTT